MMTAALAKITTGWLDPSTSALAGHMIKSYYVLEHETVFASYLLSFNNFYLFKFLDYSTLLLECAFIFCVFSQRYFRLVCATACLFHFGVQLTMEISFTPNVIAYAFFVNWGVLYRMEPLKKGAQKLQSLSHEFGIMHLVILTLPIWTMYTQFRNPFTFDLGLRMFTGGTIAETLIMLAAVYISLKYIHHLLHDAIINSRLHPSKKEAKLYN
ncbi:hypothetical protein [Fodinibius sediminis]|nr:hypothetical protein [Fodinibius sediminis]